MSKQNRIIYAVTIAIVLAAIGLTVFFLTRGARKTVSLYDYALSLGSDELFACEDGNIYEVYLENAEDELYVHQERSIEKIMFPKAFGKEPLSESSPYEFAATYSNDLKLYMRRDGSIWVRSDVRSVEAGRTCIIPFFADTSPEAPAAEQRIELVELSFDLPEYSISQEISSITGGGDMVSGDWSCGSGLDLTGTENMYCLIFRFPEAALENPCAALFVQLEDGSHYRLRMTNFLSDAPAQDGMRYGYIALPFNADTAHIPEGQYNLAIYDRVDGEHILHASQEFSLSWEGSYCRITGGGM